MSETSAIVWLAATGIVCGLLGYCIGYLVGWWECYRHIVQSSEADMHSNGGNLRTSPGCVKEMGEK